MDNSGTLARASFIAATIVLALYAVRHYLLSFFRMFLAEPRGFSEVEGFFLPKLTVMVPMHNEEDVAADVLEALLVSDYDPDLLEIVAVNDRSGDGTGAIIDDYAARHTAIRALHRTEGRGGKAAALAFATEQAVGEIIIVFDADYVPGPQILKMLAAPFADPQTGAVMGRVVPINAGTSLVSGLLSLDRAAGYQVGQQARFNLGLVPQFGGTVGGVRRTALDAAGGWNITSLTEDTDLTCRLLLGGWKIAYVNEAECFEQAPESWDVRRGQLRRWVLGHNECFHRFGWAVMRSSVLTIRERIDLIFMLACYWTAPVLILGWLASLILFFRQQAVPADALTVALLLIGCQMFSNQASFFELATASFLDQEKEKGLLLPLTFLNFIASTGTICAALGTYYLTRIFRSGEVDWHKTIRYRTDRNGNGAKR
jgi:cellulose synthase/poly-beta-1,6-N-acetylglucosamine synthase-like glycosyltransferase